MKHENENIFHPTTASQELNLRRTTIRNRLVFSIRELDELASNSPTFTKYESVFIRKLMKQSRAAGEYSAEGNWVDSLNILTDKGIITEETAMLIWDTTQAVKDERRDPTSTT